MTATKGLKNALSKGNVHTTCSCGFPMPKYAGRYPSNCPSCNTAFESTDEAASKAQARRVSRLKHDALMRRALAKQGTTSAPAPDMSRFPKRKGLEGPFVFKGGRVLYYDPREGKYYDSESDMYVDPPNESVVDALGEAAMPRPPVGADEWQLYDLPGVAVTASQLTDALRKAAKALTQSIRKGTDEPLADLLYAVYEKHVRPVAKRTSKHGSEDTEPRGVALDYLEAVARAVGKRESVEEDTVDEAAKTPTTAKDWQIFTTGEYAKQAPKAAQDLARAATKAKAALISAMKQGKGSGNPQSSLMANLIFSIYEKYLYPTMRKHGDIGALDTEPRYVAAQFLIDVAKDYHGVSGWTQWGDRF